MSEEDILNAVNDTKGASEWTTYDEYSIPAYNTTAMRNTRWSG